jgi:hypothetical protein
MLLEKIKLHYKTLEDKVKKNFKLTVFLVVFALVLCVVMLLVREFRGWFFIGVLCVFFLWDRLTHVKPDFPYIEYFKALAPHVAESVAFFCNNDPLYSPVKSVEDVTNYDCMYIPNTNLYKFFIIKKDAGNIDADILSMLGYKIQNRVNKHLRNIAICNIYSFDNLAPRIGVVNIEDIGADVEISIYVANNPEKRQRLAQLKKEQREDKRVVTVDVDKADEDF